MFVSNIRTSFLLIYRPTRLERRVTVVGRVTRSFVKFLTIEISRDVSRRARRVACIRNDSIALVNARLRSVTRCRARTRVHLRDASVCARMDAHVGAPGNHRLIPVCTELIRPR